MNPKGPKEYSLSSLFPYPITEDRDGFIFLTDKNVTYRMAFRRDADYFPGHAFAQSLLSFSIIPINGEVTEKDPRIEITVADALTRAFEANPETIIAYTCSTEGGLERHRRILFGRWYLQNGKGFTRLQYTETKSRLYTAALFREDHPDRVEIEAVFSEVYKDK